jgi:hypothetical protein
MGMGDRAFASATELSHEIRDRHIGCVELLDFYLARAEQHIGMLCNRSRAKLQYIAARPADSEK